MQNATQSSPTSNAPIQPPAWVVHPGVSGDNLPPAGRSQFDLLVVKRKGDNKYVYDIPFPFEALTKRIQSATGTPLKQVLIPLGRSLQRTVAAPAFFQYPRVVAAVDGEAASSPLLLKDRLYLGYQEKANLIEVISYNESAARFEFQVVKDYRPGGNPKVFYANRAVCMSCHQNGAPIFSRQVWDETNANPKVAALLKTFGRKAYGVPIDRGVDVPNAIDDATDRANQFAAHQLLWREGCGRDDADAIRCRAGLFAALLQYKLSGGRDFDRSASRYQNQVAARIAANGRKAWPGGLAIGNADIPSRDPLPGEAGLTPSSELVSAATGALDNANTRAMLANLSNVPVAFDPLNPREPSDVWLMTRPEHAARAVTGLAAFVADSDIARLDRHLVERKLESRAHRARCKFARQQISAARQRAAFACLPDEGNGATIEGHLEMAASRVVEVALDRLRLPGQSDFRDIAARASSVEIEGRSRRVTLRLRRDASALRGADGDRIETIELRWPASGGMDQGDAIILVRQDFALVDAAIDQLTDEALAGRFDGFGAKPFRRDALMPELFARLGIRFSDWRLAGDAQMPPPTVESVEGSPTADPTLRPFYQHCATCHQTAERFPPNFLAGSSDRVRANLAECAERLFARLSMWRLPPESRTKSPMPPVNAVHHGGFSSEVWRHGPEFALLMRYVENALKTQTGKTPSVEEMMGRGYENLRGC